MWIPNIKKRKLQDIIKHQGSDGKKVKITTCLSVTASSNRRPFCSDVTSSFTDCCSEDSDLDNLCASPKSTSANLPHTNYTLHLCLLQKFIKTTQAELNKKAFSFTARMQSSKTFKMNYVAVSNKSAQKNILDLFTFWAVGCRGSYCVLCLGE